MFFIYIIIFFVKDRAIDLFLIVYVFMECD